MPPITPIAGGALSTIDFAVDIETDGIQVTPDTADIASSGNNVVQAITLRAKVYRMSFSPSADIAGVVTFLLGSAEIYQVTDAKEGGDYGFNVSPNYYVGATGGDIIVNLPTALACSANATYLEVT